MGIRRSKKTVVIFITIIALICKMLGFVKNSVLAYYFGTSPIVDAYVMTFAIGSITCGWIAGLVGNLTPVFNKAERKEGRSKALQCASNIHNFIIIIVTISIVLLELISPLVVKIAAPGFDLQRFNYTVHFFRIYLIGILFYASFRFTQELLNCNCEHLWAIIPDLVVSVCCILAIVISSHINASFLIYGYVIAVILQCVIVQFGSFKIGYRNALVINWDNNLRSMITMAVPIFLSNTLAEINTLVDKIFASSLESGMVSALDYANTMKDFAFQIGTIAIITMIFPILSRLWTEGRIHEFKESMLKGLNLMTIIYIPIMGGIALTGDIIIDVVFRRGQFGNDAARITANAFIVYSMSLIALSYRALFFKAFYSMQKTKFILAASSINVLLNILLNIILVETLGYMGLVMATTVSALVCLPIYFLLFRRAVPSVIYRSLYVRLLKCVLSATTMCFVLWLIKKGVNMNYIKNLWLQFGLLLTLTAIGSFVYFGICYILKVDEVNEAIETIIRKSKRLYK